MDEVSDLYSKVIICVGTHDCGDDSLNHELLADGYKSLIGKAKSRVSSPKDVIISSLIPRSDSAAS